MDEINKTDLFGNTPLITACVQNRDTDPIKTVTELLKMGSDCDARNRIGSTALHKAARWSKELSQLLLEAGAKVDVIDYRGMTPLHYAVMHGQLDCVELLIEHKAQVNYQKVINLSEPPLYYAEQKGFDDIVQCLVEHGASPLDTIT